MQLSAAKVHQPTSRTMRVPAAVGAYRVHTRVGGASAHACAHVMPATSPAISATSSSHHLTPSSALYSGGAHMHALITKPMYTSATTKQVVVGAGVDAELRRTLSYVVTWQALWPTSCVLKECQSARSVPGSNGDVCCTKRQSFAALSSTSRPTAHTTTAMTQLVHHLIASATTISPPSLLVRTTQSASSHRLPQVCHASAGGAQATDATHAAVCGLLRTASQECRRLDTRMLDADAGCPRHTHSSTSRVPTDQHGRWISPYGVTLLGGIPHTASLLPSTSPTWMHPIHLTPSPRGSLAHLTAKRLTADDESHSCAIAGMIHLDVHAVGINFRDVLNVLGMYPGDPGPPGGDCSAVVVVRAPTTSAHSATSPLLGSSVFGLAPGCLGTRCATHADLVALKPLALRHDEAASMPTVCMTVQIMLQHAVATPHTRAASERVLVHASAGGVGSAAMNMLSGLGAHVYATAGSAKKRILARTLHVRDTACSRGTSFAQTCAALTQGAGVGVVLNSLT